MRADQTRLRLAAGHSHVQEESGSSHARIETNKNDNRKRVGMQRCKMQPLTEAARAAP